MSSRAVPSFTDAERAALALAEAGTRLADRAALALAEAGTRLADRADPILADVFAAAATYYDERALADVVLHIATINAWNRLNVTTGQVAGDWTTQWVS